MSRPTFSAPSLAEDGAPEELNSLAVLSRYGGETLIVASENDEVVPASHIDAYLRSRPHAQRQVISGAAHALTNPQWDEVFVAAIVSWFRGL
jgi:pimeloyl-ACP methyl ester carboxylesterase